jgi:phage-related protein
MQEPKFEVVFLEEAVAFLESLDEKAREKILYNITKARFIHDKELLKKLTDNIWEFRTLFNKSHYRLFAFWDKSDNSEALVITTHGLTKKSGKTPLSDLRKAEIKRMDYLEQKSRKA